RGVAGREDIESRPLWKPMHLAPCPQRWGDWATRGRSGDQEVSWAMIEPFVVPSQALKARYAFLDLWESIYGNN
ncbi:MAG: hypothetical protein WBD79_27065, partial [Anaerolineae bacterium]